MAAGSILFSFLANKQKESVFEPDEDVGGGEIEVEGLVDDGAGAKGRAKARTGNRSGRYSRAAAPRPGERYFDIALDATLRQAALRQARRGRGSSGRLKVQTEDVRKKVYVRPCDKLIVFVVDASESMGAGATVRMKAAKGAVLAILRKAYQNRSTVAMVAFGGEHARIVLPPTSSIDVARRSLEHLPTGGATPFADGLMQAWRIVRSERLRNPGIRPMLVVVSDGEANVPIREGVSPLEELGRLAERVGRDGVAGVFIDAAGKPRDEMRKIAARMRASYVRMRDLTGARLLKAVPKMEK
jgi:magnesium chelatase subunit D